MSRGEYGGRGWEQGPEAEAGVRRGSSKFSLFLRSAVPDFVLVWALSTMLSLTVSFAFKSAPDVRGDALLVALMEMPLLLVLFAGSWSRRAVPFAAGGAVVYAAVALVLAVQFSAPDTALFVDGWLNDDAGNFLPFACVVVVAPILTFLLSRRSVGLVFLLLLTIVSCAWVQFLYRDWAADNQGTIIAVVAYACVAMLFVYQTYRRSVLGAQRAKKASFGRAAAYSGTIVLVCIGVAAAMFYAVISPMQLSTADIKPFQRYYSRPVVEYSGVYDNMQVENKDQTTDDTNDDVKDTNQDAEGNDNQDNGESSPVQSFVTNMVQQVATTLNPNTWTQQFTGVNYDQLKLGALIIVFLVVAAIAALIAARRSVRERRLRKLADKPRAQQVQELYMFLVERFRRLGIPRPAMLTPMEFALISQHTMDTFVAEADSSADASDGVDVAPATPVTFVRVTDIYQRSSYGLHGVDDEELNDVQRYYRAFFKNARHHVGAVRWLWKFWRI